MLIILDDEGDIIPAIDKDDDMRVSLAWNDDVLLTKI